MFLPVYMASWIIIDDIIKVIEFHSVFLGFGKEISVEKFYKKILIFLETLAQKQTDMGNSIHPLSPRSG